MADKLKNFLFKWNGFSVAFVLILICAGNITNSFMLKWSFRDESGYTDNPGYGLLDMMLGQSPKPFVFRSQLAQVLHSLVEQVPLEYLDFIYNSIVRLDTLHHIYFYKIPAADWTPVVALVYHLMYLVVIFSNIALTTLVFIISRHHKLKRLESISIMIGFSVLYPLTFQQGGYYYDFIELVGALSTMLAFLKGRLLLSTFLIFIFSFNKETFFLFPIFLYFLHPIERSRFEKISWTVLQTSICLIVREIITSGYDGNPGGVVEFHLLDNIKFWLNPASYFSFTQLVGKAILTPSLQNPIMLIPLITYFKISWVNAPTNYRSFFFASIALLLPLFALFGYRDEFRNFSLAFPSLLLISLFGVGRFSNYFDCEIPPERRSH